MNTHRVIQIIGHVTGQPTPFDGHYVVEYDPSRVTAASRLDSCHLITTPNLHEATRFSAAEAYEVWRAVDQRQLLRRDFKPNRPLTAFTVVILDPEAPA